MFLSGCDTRSKRMTQEESLLALKLSNFSTALVVFTIHFNTIRKLGREVDLSISSEKWEGKFNFRSKMFTSLCFPIRPFECDWIIWMEDFERDGPAPPYCSTRVKLLLAMGLLVLVVLGVAGAAVGGGVVGYHLNSSSPSSCKTKPIGTALWQQLSLPGIVLHLQSLQAIATKNFRNAICFLSWFQRES